MVSIKASKEAIQTFPNQKEMEKKYAQIRGLNDHQKSIEQKFNLDLKIPSDYKKTLDGDSFLCFTNLKIID